VIIYDERVIRANAGAVKREHMNLRRIKLIGKREHMRSEKILNRREAIE
jgi:hypothetical protein